MENKKEDSLIGKRKFKYEAFISYRHNTVQSRLTSILQKELEHFTIPKELRHNKQRHFLPIFRDEEELGVSSNLDETLKEALDQSRFLILFCSLETFQSRWVGEELKYFLKSHPAEDVLPVLVSGEPSQVFPKEITQKEDPENPGEFLSIEPLALDVRGESLKQQIRLIKKEKFRIIARMLNTSYDSLARRQREYELKRGIGLSLIISILGIAFGVYSTIQNNQIEALFLETRKNLIESKALEAWNLISQGEGEKALDLFSEFNNPLDQAFNSALYYPLSEMTEIYSPIMDIDPALHLRTIEQVHPLWENKTQFEASSLKCASFDFNKDYLLILDDSGKIFIYGVDKKNLVGSWTSSDFEEQSTSSLEEDSSSSPSPIYHALLVDQNKMVVTYNTKIILFNFETEKIEKILDDSKEFFSIKALSWGNNTLAVYRNSEKVEIYDKSFNLIQKLDDVGKKCLDLEDDQATSLTVEKLLWNGAGDHLLLYGLIGNSNEWPPSDRNAPCSPPSIEYGLYLIDLQTESIQKLGKNQKIYSIFEIENDWIVLQKVEEEPILYENYDAYLRTIGFFEAGDTPCHLVRFHEGKEKAVSPTYNIYDVEEENFSLVSFGKDKIPTLRINDQVILFDPNTLASTYTLRFNQPVEWVEGLNEDQFLIQTTDENLKVVNKIESTLFDTEFKMCEQFNFAPLKVFPVYSTDSHLERLLFLVHDSMGYSIIQYKLKSNDENYISVEDEVVESLLESSSSQDFLLTLSLLSDEISPQEENYTLRVYNLNTDQQIFDQSIKIGNSSSELTDIPKTSLFPATLIFSRAGENNVIFVDDHQIEFRNLKLNTNSIITSYSLPSPRFACISKDGKQIFISGEDKNLILLDENQDGNFEKEIQLVTDFPINGGEWTQDGNYLVLAGETQLSFWSKVTQELIEVEIDGDFTQIIENVKMSNSPVKAIFTSPSNLPFGGFRIGKEKNRVLYLASDKSDYYGKDFSLYVIDLDKKGIIQTFDLNEFDRSDTFGRLNVEKIDFTNHDETLLIRDIAANVNETDEAPTFHWVDLSTGDLKKLTVPNEGNNEPFLYGYVLFADNLGEEFILKDASSFSYAWSQSNGIIKIATSFFKIDHKKGLAFLQWISNGGERVKVDFENKKIWLSFKDKLFVFPIYSYDELLNKTISGLQEKA